MKPFMIALLGLLVVRVSTAQDAPAVVSRSTASVATIVGYDVNGQILGYGTGFIAGDGIIVTCDHVIRGAETIGSTFAPENVGNIEHAGISDSTFDLALLQSSAGHEHEGLTISSERPDVGEEIVVIGSPMGLSNTVTTGVVSAFRSVGDVELLQISAPVSPGSSGSPVLNGDGEVIGVVTSQFPDGQGQNFAVSAKHLLQVLASQERLEEQPAKTEAQAASYAIVVSSKTMQSSADDEAVEFRRKGFDAQVVSFRVDETLRYRVCLGKYENVDAARSDRDRLAGVDLPRDSWVIRLP